MPMSNPKIATTTISSINVNPVRLSIRLFYHVCLPEVTLHFPATNLCKPRRVSISWQASEARAAWLRRCGECRAEKLSGSPPLERRERWCHEVETRSPHCTSVQEIIL